MSADRPPVSGEPRTTLDDLIWAARAWGQEEGSQFALPSTLEAHRKEVEDIRAAIEAEASTGAALDVKPPPIAVDAWVAGYLAGREEDQWRTDDEIAERAVDAACAVWMARLAEQEGDR